MSRPLPNFRRATAPATTPVTPDAATFAIAELTGRLCELATTLSGAALTLAFRLVLDAQASAEPVAWVMPVAASFFPPDAHAGGVDLAALVVVRTPTADEVARVADPLLRSGAFGLVVLDVGIAKPPQPLLTRLLGLAQKHEAAVVFLTDSNVHPNALQTNGATERASLGSLISWRAEVARQRRADGEFVCALEVVKDKRRGPGFRYEEVCNGPAGLR